jgi:hypothetical protein
MVRSSGLILLLLLLLATTLATGCDLGRGSVRAESGPADRARELTPPQFHVDDAAAAKQRRAALDWNLKTLVTAYEQVGRRSPKWDNTARKGLTLVARDWADDPERPGDTADEAWYSLRQAITYGCDDPLVQYVAVRYGQSDLAPLEAARRVYEAAMRLQTTSYPAYVRSSSLIKSAQALSDASVGVTPEEWAPRWSSIIVLINQAHDLMPDVFKDRDAPAGQLVDYVDAFYAPWVSGHQNRQKAFDHVLEEALKVRDAKDPLLALLRADFFVGYAWDARGGKWADDVKPEAWPIFEDRLRQAEVEAAKAVALGSIDLTVVRTMNRVLLGLAGDPREMEAWYQLGIRLAPGDDRVPYFKMKWLEPKWHGSLEEMLAFAHEMQHSDNWAARLPLLMVTAHEDLAGMLDTSERDAYLAHPEVCANVLETYAAFLERYPDAGWDRGAYIKWLGRCGRWSNAKRQFGLLAPDRLRVGAFDGQAKYEELRRRATAAQ